jgi:16S rRNA (cytidine1402-2'-O)-methyltransferase
VGTLFVVGTPIGNLEDITLRAIRVLQEVDLIAAEDTRRARTLLNRYEINTPLISYFEHSGAGKRERILSDLRNRDIALISEAGMPGISDPGHVLIREAIQREFRVVPVPGPSALVSALVVSGLPTDSFIYLGFMSRRKGERQQTLREIRNDRRTLIVYEAPHRLLACLEDMLDILDDRTVAIARELTKLHEEIFRGTISSALAHFREVAPRGEFTLIVQGVDPTTETERFDVHQVHALARRLLNEGMSTRDAAAEAARRTGWSRREIYGWLHGRETGLDSEDRWRPTR